MATSGTTAFSPDVAELLEEAYERAGLELRTGYDLRTGIRSFNFMMAEWANRGLNLWTLEAVDTTIGVGVQTITLPADTVDVLDAVVRVGSGTSTADYPMERMSVGQWVGIVNKSQTGSRPFQFMIGRVQPAPTMSVWPVPTASVAIRYWRLRRIQDGGAAGNTADIPFRFIPALVSGLAYHIASKKPEAADRVLPLKQIYDEAFQLAADEDRDRSSLWFTPDLR